MEQNRMQYKFCFSLVIGVENFIYFGGGGGGGKQIFRWL